GTTDDFDGTGGADPVGFTNLTSMDGSGYDPFTDSMLFTSESGANGRVVQVPVHWTSTALPLSPSAIPAPHGSIGRGGYEGVVLDRLGEVYLAEDVGGSNINDNGTATTVRQPNSFIYRFVPSSSSSLTAGKLQVLQITDAGTPITWHDPVANP